VCAVIFNFLEGFRTGTTVLIARERASGPDGDAAGYFRTGIILAAAAGAVIALASSPLANIVYHLLGNAQLESLGGTYLIIWLCAIPSVLMLNVVIGFFRGSGDTVTPLTGTFIICALNAGCSYLFVYGGFGLSGLGIAGSALGTLISQIAGFAAMSVLLFKKYRDLRIGKIFRSGGIHAREYMRLSAHIGINTGSTLLALLLFVAVIKDLGSAAIAVHQISIQVFNAAYLPASGLLVTASIIVPGLAKRGHHRDIGPSVRKISHVSFAIVALICAVIFIGSRGIGIFFSPADSSVAQTASYTIRIVCAGGLFSSMYMVLRGALTGWGDAGFIAVEGVCSGYLLFLPLAYLLSHRYGYGIVGGYAAFLAWCIADFTALTVRFGYRRRKAERDYLRQE
jgi:putative MATE family efflux protein